MYNMRMQQGHGPLSRLVEAPGFDSHPTPRKERGTRLVVEAARYLRHPHEGDSGRNYL